MFEIFKSKQEEVPEKCKHGNLMGNCDQCQMSPEEAHREANLIRAAADQGGRRRENYVMGGETYPSRKKGMENIGSEELTSSAGGYTNAERILGIDRENKKYGEMEAKLAGDPDAKPEIESREQDAKRREEKAKFIAEAQMGKEERRELYKKLKEEFEPEKK